MSDIKSNINHDVVSIHDSDLQDESKIITQLPAHISFKKSLQLFFSNKTPEKKQRPKFFLWSPPGQSKFEKRLVFKLDAAILTYVCLSYFVRYLDATNISSAYITGMKEDLNISGEEYVWLTQLFSAAYSFSGFFATMILTRVRFSRMIPLLEIFWGVMTLAIYKSENFKTVAILRFFQGLAEGAAWPCIHYCLGSWYTKGELGKRVSIFTASGIVGVLLSGLIQSGLQKNLDGHYGLAGWRWLFIIDACLTFPIAILGFFIFPDSPETAKVKFYLNEEEISLAQERVKINGKERIDKLDSSTFKRVFTSYQWYLFVTAWVIWGLSGYLSGYMGIVLKALNYDVYNRNNIPTGISGVGIITVIISGFIIDITGSRIYVALILSAIQIMGVSLIVAFDIPRGVFIFGYMCLGMHTGISPLIVGWCNELAKEDNQVRAATIGSLNLFSGLLGIPFATGLFNTDYAPRYTKAVIGTLIATIVLFFYFFVILAFDRYQQRKRDYIKKLSY